ncbi:glycopeptide, partial [Lentinula boryana]
MFFGRRSYFPFALAISTPSVVERLRFTFLYPNLTIMFAFLNVFFALALFAGSAFAAPIKIRSETHTINMVNNCGSGTPTLVQNGNVLSTGSSYTASGEITAIAYLNRNGECLLNGENCTTLELTLTNPTVPGAGSSTDVTLISPHAFNVGVGFSYFNGCDGQGQTCATADCTDAFRTPTDYFAQTQCETNNVGLTITF